MNGRAPREEVRVWKDAVGENSMTLHAAGCRVVFEENGETPEYGEELTSRQSGYIMRHFAERLNY